MKLRHFLNLSLSLVLSAFAAAGPCAPALRAQTVTPTPAAAPASTDLQARLEAAEKVIEAKRKELGVPGASLVVVKDDKVVYMKGLGVKDFEKQTPVTPDTLFAIGSSSKAFTAMLVAMAADAGRLSFDDPPKKFLPYFKLQDPEADAKITVRDLLSHSSGLNRTDIAWITGALNREEVIRVAAQAKPTAKLREKFQYQNVMYSAAGEVAARAFGSTWEASVEKRIFRPLGKRLGTYQEFFDGAQGGEGGSFMPLRPKTGKGLVDARVASDFYGPLNWKTLYQTAELKRRGRLGEEEVYVVVLTPEKGNPVTQFYSAQTFRLLRQDTLVTSGPITEPVTERYSDYREVDGVLIPFTRVTSSPSNGDTVIKVREVKFDVEVPADAFRWKEEAGKK